MGVSFLGRAVNWMPGGVAAFGPHRTICFAVLAGLQAVPAHAMVSSVTERTPFARAWIVDVKGQRIEVSRHRRTPADQIRSTLANLLSFWLHIHMPCGDQVFPRTMMNTRFGNDAAIENGERSFQI